MQNNIDLFDNKEVEQEKRDVEIRKKLRQSWYPSEIVLAKVVELLQNERWKHTTEIKDFNNLLLGQIDDWQREVASAE